jgi:UTP:GlnB (protein PII) uridylyltransferase
LTPRCSSQRCSAAKRNRVSDGADRWLQVRAHDTAGLLYRLTRQLADAGLDVRSATVDTLGAEAVDTFYVVARGGGPTIGGSDRAAVQAGLLAACEPTS